MLCNSDRTTSAVVPQRFHIGIDSPLCGYVRRRRFLGKKMSMSAAADPDTDHECDVSTAHKHRLTTFSIYLPVHLSTRILTFPSPCYEQGTRNVGRRGS